MAGTLFRLPGWRRGLRISCCIVGICPSSNLTSNVAGAPQPFPGPEAHNHSKGQRPTTSETEARVSATFSPLNQRILEASSQDRVPECDPVSPAASSPRREGLPPAAKVGALYQADSLIVKGSGGQKPEFGYQKSERELSLFRLPISSLPSAD